MCGQWVPINGSGCLKHRVSSTYGVGSGKADGVGAGSLWLRGEALWVCWHRNRPALPSLAQMATWPPLKASREVLVHRCLCPWVVLSTLVSAVPGGLVTIYTSWGSSPCILYPTTENKNSARRLTMFVWVERSCSADLNGAIHMLRARPVLKYTAESALVCVLKYNSDFCNQGQCQALVYPCLESRY